MRILKIRRDMSEAYLQAANIVYVGRPTPVGNPYSHRSGRYVQYRVVTKREAIDRYRRWLWERIRDRDREVLDFLRAIPEDANLGCFCVNRRVPHPVGQESCHAEVLVRALSWLRLQEWFDQW